ncbi:MAG TPA: hypothetical protein VF942_15635 [Acidimicrobiales bacterium]
MQDLGLGADKKRPFRLAAGWGDGERARNLQQGNEVESAGG